MNIKLENLPQTILISVLNWNTAETTLECIRALLRLDVPPYISLEIILIDNGSAEADYAALALGTQHSKITLRREQKNRGFAGGHNRAIRIAIEKRFDFIWLLNSDAIVEQRDVLAVLIAEININPRCGAISPLIVSMQDDSKIDFCGALHDWKSCNSIRAKNIEESKRLYNSNPNDMWVTGTAILLRVETLKQIGELDERLFAYYEDDDIGARLAASGWLSLVAYQARVKHVIFARETDRPAYYYYLLQRNFLIFWFGRTPTEYRYFLWVKLLDRAIFDVNRLYYNGFNQQADASLLGIYDFIRERHGAPNVNRSVPLVMKCIRKILWFQQMKIIKKMARMKRA